MVNTATCKRSFSLGWVFTSMRGVAENDLSYMPDGRIISVLRLSAGGLPWSFYYSAFSSDEGLHFTHPQPMPGLGSCRPKLALVPPALKAPAAADGGTLLLSGGRLGCDGAHGFPGKAHNNGCKLNTSGSDNYVWLNTDGKGESWLRHSVSGIHNRLVQPPPGAQGWRFPASINTTDWDGNVTNDCKSGSPPRDCADNVSPHEHTCRHVTYRARCEHGASDLPAAERD